MLEQKGILMIFLPLKLNRFEQEFYTFIDAKYSNILSSIRDSKNLDGDTEEELKKAIEDFKTQFAV